MLRFAADENLHGAIVVGLLRRRPDIDLVRIQDEEVYGADDSAVLEWCAREGRILLTHDRRTMVRTAYALVGERRPMGGVFLIAAGADVGRSIDHLLRLAEDSVEGDWADQVRFIPR